MMIIGAIQISLVAFQAIATFMVAVLGLTIAYRNAVTTRTALRLELFEKRFAVYRAIIEFLDAASVDDALTGDQVRKFLRATADTTFLFEDDVVKYVFQLGIKRGVRSEITRLKNDPNPKQQSEGVLQEIKFTGWLFNQYEEVNKLFLPYVGFKNIRA